MDNPIRGYPVEIVDHWFDAIRLAVGNGIVVVEAAGNGYFDANNDRVGRDLDQLQVDWADAPTWRSMDRASPLFLDSGAIVVSACSSAVAPDGAPQGTHRRMDWATYGSRIDCYAWGEDVYTAGYGWLEPADPTKPDDWYTDRWNGTSAASAIIAGAAVLVQQMNLVTRNWRLSPTQVRALLSNKALGVPVVDNVGATVIGTMPDLAAIADELDAIPDVYIRDSVDDGGAVPSPTVSMSPDIIIRQVAVPNPGTHFGAAGPWVTAVPPIDPVRPGQPNYVYVRLRNRGADATGVAVKLYWSEASPLVAPVHWREAVKFTGIAVPGGDVLTVAGPEIWTPAAGDLPTSGHGCFVAVVDHPLDPQPPLLPSSATWNDFLAYVGRNNNAAWRNFMVLAAAAAEDGLSAEAEFVIHGSGDETREFSFELIQRLPDHARIFWNVPDELAEELRSGARRTTTWKWLMRRMEIALLPVSACSA